MSKYGFKFKDYSPWIFRKIRENFKIDAGSYLMSLTNESELSELFSPGKSQCFFYYSKDYKYIIKTIHSVEHLFLRKILANYYNYLKDNNSTFLCRILGLHRIKMPFGKKIHLLVMQNLFPPNVEIEKSYDLKGSTVGRIVSDATNKTPMKDLNWKNNKMTFEFGPIKAEIFKNQIEKDANFLREMNIMDYSLLVGISTKKLLVENIDEEIYDTSEFKVQGTNIKNVPISTIYYIGIIDILTPYNYAKKIETVVKSLKYSKEDLSAVNPQTYALRFINFISKHIPSLHLNTPIESNNNSEENQTKSDSI